MESNPFEYLGTTKEDVMGSLISGAYIIEFGFIKKVINIDLVSVQIGACTSPFKMSVFPCVMGSLCSNNMTVKVDPKEGDKVIIFYPKAYHQDMFDPETKGTIYETDACGYSFGNGIAFLANQFFTDAYNQNFIHVTKDKVDMGITDKPVSIKVKPDGDNYTSKLDIKTDGGFTYEIKGKLTISADANGDITLDAQKGKLDFKNTAGGSLGQALSTLIDDLSSATVMTTVTGTLTPPTAVAGTGTGGFAPATTANLTKDKTTLSNLLK